MTSVYEFIQERCTRTNSALSSINADLEALNSKIIRTFVELGLTDQEARVLLFINKNRERKVSEMAKSLGIPRTHFYFVLQSLESKGLVFSTLERPAKYRALALDKAVDFLIDSYRHKLHSLQKAREVISDSWSVLQEYEVVANTELEPLEQNVQIISGECQIYTKAKNIIMQARKEVNVFVNAGILAKISNADVAKQLPLLASKGIAVKILTKITPVQTSLLEEANGCEIREMPPSFNDAMCFIIVDHKELLLLNLHKTKQVSGMWTNSRSLIDAMSLLFMIGWSST